MKQFSMLGILFLFTFAAFGQGIDVRGRMLDATTGESINFGVIQSDLARSSTDGDGRFVIEATSGSQVVFSAIGYTSESLTITAGESSNLTVRLFPAKEKLETIEVIALRANDNVPIAKTDMDESDIEANDVARDMPYILENTASVVSTSDGGTGIGYTGLRIRGSDQARINVTINGIPVNDAESQGVFWVNTPDLASSVSQMQIQRGVGTSTNGAGAFGGSINMETKSLTLEPYADINIGGGSFNTQRYTLAFGTGLMNGHWTLDARASRIKSDGWIERASSDLRSYYAALGYINGNTTIKAVIFGGRERTYQAWYGTDSSAYRADNRFNYAGAIYDANWNVVDYYNDQVDNYGQDYYQLHINHKFNDTWSGGVSGFYTRGKGYYQEYQQWQNFADYGMTPLIFGTDTISSTDLTRRLWLDNHYYGVVANARGQYDKLTLTIGGAWNQYDGDHYGEFLWAEYSSNLKPGDHFYDNSSLKTVWNVYAKAEYALTDKLGAYLDLQLRNVDYSGGGTEEEQFQFDFADQLSFFNPKAGLVYKTSDNSRAYVSYAMANREPNRKDYFNAVGGDKPRPEQLQDIEFGYEGGSESFNWSLNGYYMYYTDQLVLTGALDNVGYPIRENVGESYRAGIEISAGGKIGDFLSLRGNLTLSDNKNVNYVISVGDTATQNLGNTPIAYSPAVIANATATLHLPYNIDLGITPRYISQQYLSNTGDESLVLPAYFVTDLRLGGTWSLEGLKRIRAYVMANNVFSEEYASNGYVYGSDVWFYPQAPINYMFGIEFNF